MDVFRKYSNSVIRLTRGIFQEFCPPPPHPSGIYSSNAQICFPSENLTVLNVYWFQLDNLGHFLGKIWQLKALFMKN